MHSNVSDIVEVLALVGVITLVTSEQLFYDLYIVDSRADCASVGADDAQLGRSDKPRGALSRSKTFFPRSVCGGDFEENTSDVTPRARKTR